MSLPTYKRDMDIVLKDRAIIDVVASGRSNDVYLVFRTSEKLGYKRVIEKCYDFAPHFFTPEPIPDKIDTQWAVGNIVKVINKTEAEIAELEEENNLLRNMIAGGKQGVKYFFKKYMLRPMPLDTSIKEVKERLWLWIAAKETDILYLTTYKDCLTKLMNSTNRPNSLSKKIMKIVPSGYTDLWGVKQNVVFVNFRRSVSDVLRPRLPEGMLVDGKEYLPVGVRDLFSAHMQADLPYNWNKRLEYRNPDNIMPFKAHLDVETLPLLSMRGHDLYWGQEGDPDDLIINIGQYLPRFEFHNTYLPGIRYHDTIARRMGRFVRRKQLDFKGTYGRQRKATVAICYEGFMDLGQFLPAGSPLPRRLKTRAYFCSNEGDLMSAYVRDLWKWKPDVLAGWWISGDYPNNYGDAKESDMAWIYKALQREWDRWIDYRDNADYPNKNDFGVGPRHLSQFNVPYSAAMGEDNRVRITGLQIFDTLYYLRKLTRKSGIEWKLGPVGERYGIGTKISPVNSELVEPVMPKDHRGNHLKYGDSRIDAYYNEEREYYGELVSRLAAYNAIDCLLDAGICDKSGVFKRFWDISNKSRIFLQDSHKITKILDGTSITKYMNDKVVLPSKVKRTRYSYIGAYIPKPSVGVFKCVADLDFESLYPKSLGILVRLTTAVTGLSKRDTALLNVVWATVSEALTEKGDLKKAIKKMKKEGMSPELAIVIIFYEFLKVIINGAYGTIGEGRSRFSCMLGAQMITSIAQSIIRVAIEAIESELELLGRYTHTDSTYNELIDYQRWIDITEYLDTIKKATDEMGIDYDSLVLDKAIRYDLGHILTSISPDMDMKEYNEAMVDFALPVFLIAQQVGTNAARKYIEDTYGVNVTTPGSTQVVLELGSIYRAFGIMPKKTAKNKKEGAKANNFGVKIWSGGTKFCDTDPDSKYHEIIAWTGGKKKENRVYVAKLYDLLATLLCDPRQGSPDRVAEKLIEDAVREIQSGDVPLEDLCSRMKFNRDPAKYAPKTAYSYSHGATVKIMDKYHEMGDEPRRVPIKAAEIDGQWCDKLEKSLQAVLFDDETRALLDEIVEIDQDKLIKSAVGSLQSLLTVAGVNTRALLKRLLTGDKRQKTLAGFLGVTQAPTQVPIDSFDDGMGYEDLVG